MPGGRESGQVDHCPKSDPPRISCLCTSESPHPRRTYMQRCHTEMVLTASSAGPPRSRRCAEPLRARCRRQQNRLHPNNCCSALFHVSCISSCTHSTACNGSCTLSQVPGLIVVELLGADAAGAADGVRDPKYERVVAAFNARPEAHLLRWPPGLLFCPRLYTNTSKTYRTSICKSNHDSASRYVRCLFRSPCTCLYILFGGSIAMAEDSSCAPCMVRKNTHELVLIYKCRQSGRHQSRRVR
jgi:hypothetical protein